MQSIFCHFGGCIHLLLNDEMSGFGNFHHLVHHMQEVRFRTRRNWFGDGDHQFDRRIFGFDSIKSRIDEP